MLMFDLIVFAERVREPHKKEGLKQAHTKKKMLVFICMCMQERAERVRELHKEEQLARMARAKETRQSARTIQVSRPRENGVFVCVQALRMSMLRHSMLICPFLRSCVIYQTCDAHVIAHVCTLAHSATLLSPQESKMEAILCMLEENITHMHTLPSITFHRRARWRPSYPNLKKRSHAASSCGWHTWPLSCSEQGTRRARWACEILLRDDKACSEQLD